MGIKATLVVTVVNLVEDELVVVVLILEGIIFIAARPVFWAYEDGQSEIAAEEQTPISIRTTSIQDILYFNLYRKLLYTKLYMHSLL